MKPIQTIFSLATDYREPPIIERVKIERPRSTWLQKRRQELYLRECGNVSIVLGDNPLDKDQG